MDKGRRLGNVTSSRSVKRKEHHAINKAVYEWFSLLKRTNFLVGIPILTGKGLEFAKTLNFAIFRIPMVKNIGSTKKLSLWRKCIKNRVDDWLIGLPLILC